MKKIIVAALFTISALFFVAGASFHYYDGNKTVLPLSCVSQHTLIHGAFVMKARYFFSFYNNRGVVRVNGAVFRDGKTYPVSRQIFFNYTRDGDEYTINSTYIEKMSADKGEMSGAELHLPSFFSSRDRQFNFTLHQDRFRNAIIIFTEMPIFYCARRSLPLRS